MADDKKQIQLMSTSKLKKHSLLFPLNLPGVCFCTQTKLLKFAPAKHRKDQLQQRVISAC